MTRTFDFDVVFARIVDAVTARTDAYAVGLMEAAGHELTLLRTNVTGADVADLPYRHVRVDDEVSLVLHLSSDRVGGFSHDDADFAAGLVEVAALALRNARLR